MWYSIGTRLSPVSSASCFIAPAAYGQYGQVVLVKPSIRTALCDALRGIKQTNRKTKRIISCKGFIVLPLRSLLKLSIDVY